jgi:hypothetical protein
MSTLDHPSGGIDPSAVSIRPVSLRYGLIGGLALVVISLVLQLTGMTDSATGKGGWLAFLLSLVVMFGVIYLAIQKHRDDELGGFMSFGRGLGVGALTSLIMLLISAVFTFLYFTVIDPGIIETMMENSIAQMEEQGLSDDQIEQSMGFVKWMMNPVFLTISGTIVNYIVAFILSIIGAGILSRKDPAVA